MSTVAALQRIRDRLDLVSSLTAAQVERGEVDLEHLITEYVALRKSLARDFRSIAEAELQAGEPALDSLRRQVAQRMTELYGGRIPDNYLKVSGYTGVHRILFEYLARHVSEPITASRLRVLTGDQVHTERRLRELRDLGLDVSSARVADDDQYILKSTQPDLNAAARFQVERNVRNDRKLGDRERQALLEGLPGS